ncbi:MAG: hypothetical protein QOH92_589 [Chloroflexota bacterium]|nr:hypothetical protein [Chloroflexota bacterium]
MDNRYRLGADDGTTFETDDVRAYNRELVELGADLMGEGEHRCPACGGAECWSGTADHVCFNLACSRNWLKSSAR